MERIDVVGILAKRFAQCRNRLFLAAGPQVMQRPSDLKPFSFQASLMNQTSGSSYRGGPSAPTSGVAMMATSAAHMAPAKAASGWHEKEGPDSETTLDGNSVSLEDQMLKMTDARMNYDAAISFYQKSMNMLRQAARKPNG